MRAVWGMQCTHWWSMHSVWCVCTLCGTVWNVWIYSRLMVGLYSPLHQPICVQLPKKLLKLSGPTGPALDSYNLDNGQWTCIKIFPHLAMQRAEFSTPCLASLILRPSQLISQFFLVLKLDIEFSPHLSFSQRRVHLTTGPRSWQHTVRRQAVGAHLVPAASARALAPELELAPHWR